MGLVVEDDPEEAAVGDVQLEHRRVLVGQADRIAVVDQDPGQVGPCILEHHRSLKRPRHVREVFRGGSAQGLALVEEPKLGARVVSDLHAQRAASLGDPHHGAGLSAPCVGFDRAFEAVGAGAAEGFFATVGFEDPRDDRLGLTGLPDEGGRTQQEGQSRGQTRGHVGFRFESLRGRVVRGHLKIAPGCREGHRQEGGS